MKALCYCFGVICLFLGCKQEKVFIPETLAVRAEKGMVYNLKDIENQNVELNFWKARLIDQQGSQVGLEYYQGSSLLVTLLPIHTVIEKALSENPKLILYLRAEVREYRDDVVKNGKTYMNAGQTPSDWSPVYGYMMVDRQTYTISEMIDETKKELNKCLLYISREKKPYKLVLSLYDARRYTPSTPIWSRFWTVPNNPLTSKAARGWLIGVGMWICGRLTYRCKIKSFNLRRIKMI